MELTKFKLKDWYFGASLSKFVNLRNLYVDDEGTLDIEY